jgi:hypothetical protein
MKLGLAALPLAGSRTLAQSTPAAGNSARPVDALAAMRAMVVPERGPGCAWWFFGTLSVHVDGLREFPIALVESVRLCRSEVLSDDVLVCSWSEIGCYRDLVTGAIATGWLNPYTSQLQPLPHGFVQGPGTWRVARTDGSVVVTLEEAMARVTKATLTAQLNKGRTVLTLSETKIRSFPTLDGGRQPPDVAMADVTQDRTVCSFIGDADVAARPAGHGAASSYYSAVYDDVPSWLGFGERLGGAFAKGVLRRAALDERVNPTSWKSLQQLHPAYFAHGKLQLP